MTFKEAIHGAVLDDKAIARILKNTGTTDLAKPVATELIKMLWEEIAQTDGITSPSSCVICYAVKLFTGNLSNFHLRRWYELCPPDWQLHRTFRPVPSFEEIDIWNLDGECPCDLSYAEAWRLEREGHGLYKPTQVRWNNLGQLLGAQVVGGGLFNIKNVATEVLMEQYLYQQRGITPSLPQYSPTEYFADNSDWIEQFTEDQRLQNYWRRECCLFNTISRYNAIKEAALLAKEE